jgi:hypothetical protein
MNNKYNIQVVLGNKMNYNYIDQLEKYNNDYYYIIRRTRLKNNQNIRYAIELAFPLILQKTINYVASKER